ncbi:MAG: prenyltransferase [Bacteroidales bacterium]|jgi:1,4-dihydroxy-2-naphthoate octaprenyltransferase|nr:prenyltransferase [Bacteroidales bacterium]
MKNILFWLNNARYIALPQSILPTLVAICYASTHSNFRFIYALLPFVGITCAHLAFNLFDDYFDYKKGSPYTREKLIAEGFRARLGKCDYITSGAATMKELCRAASLFLVAAILLGTIIFLKWGVGIVYLTLTGGILGFFYSAPPFRLSYRGLGLPVIIIMFGPLLMSGIMYAACGRVDTMLIYLSIPIGILVANIAYVHDVMDVEPDKKVGKKTLAVLLNNYTSIYIIAALFNFSPWILVGAGVLSGILNTWYLVTLLFLPNSIYLFILLIRFRKNPARQIQPQWWMQPMERWGEIRKGGIDWFMIRWYLARNILIYFCLICIVVMIIT